MNTNVHHMHYFSQAKCARDGMVLLCAPLQNVHMRNKPQYFKEWRKHKGLTQEALSERLAEVASRPEFQRDARVENLGKDRTTISKIESGKVRYTQTLIEMLAEIYGTDPGSLIMRNPLSDEPLYSIWDSIPASARSQALAYLRGIADATSRTGTDG